MKKIMLAMLITLSASFSHGQTSATNMGGFKRKIATVMFAGLGGAVLGLSTLSFYGQPEEHIGNIWAGLALGLIGGAVYVSFDSPETSTDYGKMQWPQNPNQQKPQAPSLVAYSWNF